MQETHGKQKNVENVATATYGLKLRKLEHNLFTFFTFFIFLYFQVNVKILFKNLQIQMAIHKYYDF